MQPKSRNDRGSRSPGEPLQDDAGAWPFAGRSDDLVTRVVGAHDDAPTPIARPHDDARTRVAGAYDDAPTRVVDANERMELPIDEEVRTAVYRPKSQPLQGAKGRVEGETPWPTKDEVPTARSTPRSQKITQREAQARLAPGLPRFAIIGVILGFGVLGAVVTTWLVHRMSRMTVLVRDDSGDRHSAGVFVDGSRRCDFSPCVLEEAPGDHIVTVAVEGAPPMIQNATFRAGDDSTMTFVLPLAAANPATTMATAPAPAQSVVTAAPPASAQAPSMVSSTPPVVSAAAAAPSPRGPAPAMTIVATAPRAAVTAPVAVRDTANRSASAGTPCKLQFNSMPVADLNLDGVSIGETPRTNVSAQPGEHRVTFDTGDMKKTVAFRCGDGEEKTIAVRLP